MQMVAMEPKYIEKKVQRSHRNWSEKEKDLTLLAKKNHLLPYLYMGTPAEKVGCTCSIPIEVYKKSYAPGYHLLSNNEQFFPFTPDFSIKIKYYLTISSCCA